MAGIKVISPPAAEPVLLVDVKPQLRIDSDDTTYDDILTPLIIAAREWCEGYQNRAYITQTLEIALDYWHWGKSRIELPRPPIQSITSLKYTDSSGTELIWDPSNYRLDDYSYVPALVKNRYIYWPQVVLLEANGIKIQYIVGYGADGDSVPQAIKQAIIMLTTFWFDNGVCEPPTAVKSLLMTDRVMPV